jgi:dynein heavy chain
MIAQDKEIVKVILLLTGSIQGTRQRVNDFKVNFNRFNHLWEGNIDNSLKDFEKKTPTLQDYEDKLKKFTQVEEDIDKIQSAHLIGAMELKTEGLCNGLKHWSKEWKNKYAENLHKRARTNLYSLTEQTKHLDIKLKKEVKDIDSLGMTMETLEDIRKIQAEIDMKFTPVNEMYNLLENFLPNGLTDKEELDARTMLNNNWDSVIKFAEFKQKELQ